MEKKGEEGEDAAPRGPPEGELNQDLVSSSVGRPTSLGSAIARASIRPPSYRDRLRSWLARRGVSLEDAEDAIGPQELDQIQCFINAKLKHRSTFLKPFRLIFTQEAPNLQQQIYKNPMIL